MKKEKRPFFSIVIPCYNTSQKHMKRLLSSIRSDFAWKDTEIIIVDDNSTDKSFLDVVDTFISKYKMNIKRVFVPEGTVHCPGNSREYAIQFCTGEWLTFIDHDDYIDTNGLFLVRRVIKKYKEPRYLSTGFTKITNGKFEDQVYGKPTSTFLHGKYFNLDNFWKKYDIHFKKDMKLEEDVYICSIASSILEGINQARCNYDKSTYIWDINDGSFGSFDIDGITTVMIYFKDYIDATNTVYYDMYKANIMTKENYIEHTIFNFLSLYTVMEKFFYDYYHSNKKGDNNYELILKANIIYTTEAINRFKKESNFSNTDILNYIKKDNKIILKDTTISNNLFATGHFLFTHTFSEWLDLHSKVEYDNSDFCNLFFAKADAYEDEYHEYLMELDKEVDELGLNEEDNVKND